MARRSILAIFVLAALVGLMLPAEAQQGPVYRLRNPPVNEFALKGHGGGQPGPQNADPRNVVMYMGTVVGGPLWDRPIACGPTISGLGPVRYHVQPFTVSAAGNYDITSVQAYDGYLHIYQTNFDPTAGNQATNCIASNDDGAGGIGTSEVLGLALTSGTQYFVVTSAFSATDEGTFDNTLSGPGTISLGGNAPDVAITVTPSVTTATGGDQFDIDVEVSNLGPGAAANVVANLTLGNATIDSATCGAFPWNIGALADGASQTCTVTVTVTTCGPVPITGTVDADGFDSPTNNSDSEQVNPNEVADPGFEDGTPNSFWTEASTNFGTPICDAGTCGVGGGTGPRTGTFWSWFGGIAAPEEGSMTQSVVIPAGDAAVLTFWTENTVCSNTAADFLEATIDTTQVYNVTSVGGACTVLGYALQTIDISSFADDASHTLEFHSIIGGSATANFFVDDVAIVSCTTVVGPPPPGPPAIPTLDTLGLLALAVLLGGGAMIVMARRRRTI